MKIHALFRTRAFLLSSLAVGVAAGGVAVRETMGSDHQQSALTELNPQLDINDVYVFPGSADDRIVLAMTVVSPTAPAGTAAARFDPNALYQLHVDNNQDGRDDVVLQFSFDELADGTQTVDVIGPVAPRQVQVPGVGVSSAFSTSAPNIRRGAIGSTLTAQLAASGAATAGTMQVFAGLRDDPFYVDLEQFLRIIPDRRPTTGPASQIGGVIPAAPGTVAAAFRPACTNNVPNPGQTARDARFGCAQDFLAGVVELPESQLTQGRGGGQLGVWATVGR